MNYEITFVQKERDENPVKKAMQNLLTHVPGEATGLYLAALDMFGDDASATTLVVIALVSLGVLLLVRWLAKSSPAVIVVSVVAFVLWVWVLGNGPFQAYGLNLPQGVGAFLVVAYSTVITILATYGKIK